ATVLPMAKPGPSTAQVAANIPGSVTGDDSQKAITGARGTPAASSPVISGRTVTPQTGVTAPIAEARAIIATGRLWKERAVTVAAPLAVTQADSSSPNPIMGATSR